MGISSIGRFGLAGVVFVGICGSGLAAWADDAAGRASASPSAAVDLPSQHKEVPQDWWLPSLRIADERGVTAADVGNQVNVNEDGQNILNDAANEPSIAIDPTDPRRIVIGWRQFDTIQSNFRQAGYAYSNDSGRSWTFPDVIERGIFRSDPVLDADADGDFYYLSLSTGFCCDVFRSSDGGRTWPSKSAAVGGDKAWMVIDRTDGIGRGNIYQTWNGTFTCNRFQRGRDFTRSTDGGSTWSDPITLPQRQRWGTLAIGKDGELYIGAVGGTSGVFVVMRSSNAQDPDQDPVFELNAQLRLGGSVPFGGTPNPAGILGQAWIAVDTSDGPHSGNVYMLCSVDPPGNDPLDVMFARSTDGGETWSEAIRINDDPGGTNAWQWFGTMSVAPGGRIDVIWNDTRNTGVGTKSQVFYSSSSDGGQTWSKNEALTPEFDSTIGWPQQNKIGDYYDMISDDVGASLAYAATFNGEQDVYFRRIGDYDCNGNGVGDAIDIARGDSKDCNANGIPDECEHVPPACDANCDGSVDLTDVGPFIELLLGGEGCSACAGDTNGDGSVDLVDVEAFLECLLGG